MVLANEPKDAPVPPAKRRPRSRRRPADAPTPADASGSPLPDGPTRADALRRIAADVSGELNLDRLFEHVIDEAFGLFGVDRAGLWTYHDAPTPLRLAAQRGLSPEMLDVVARLPRDAATSGMTAMRERRVTVLDGDLAGTVPQLQRMYRAQGIRTMCYVPIVVRDDVLGLLVLYHRSDYRWSSDEMDLARAFGDQIAIAMRNIGLAASSRSLAERLRSISELAGRLARQQDANGIARTIVDGARRVVDHDSIRVYRVDHDTGMCEPIAFQGTLLGTRRPDPAKLRMAIGEGLTGWVAANGVILRLGDAAADPRSKVIGDTSEPESMLLVPMTYQDDVQGVIVVSRLGHDRFDADDETTVSIFAGYAAQALVNASNRTQLERQQVELEHQLASQQRLLQVNERLLSTLEPANVLDLIADSLKAIVPYDSLSIYEIDRAAGVRRAIIARDRFADLILAHESPLGVGINGWVAENGEAVLSNDAHLDPRSVQIPGTPFEPESMIVVPLLVNGETIGTLNIGRIGEAEAHFSTNEFELTKLFAGQASIALQNARTHGEVQNRAEHDALTGLRNHGAFQRELGEAVEIGGGGKPFAVLMMDLDAFKAFNDSQGHPAGDELLAGIAQTMSATIRDGDRIYRYGGDEFSALLPATDRVAAHDVAERLRRAVAALTESQEGPAVTISIGVACFPDDGRAKGALVTVADQAMYLAKPAHRQAASSSDDPYLRALDETALALLDRRDSTVLLETIMTRASALLGTPHGFIYIAEPDGSELVLKHGSGLFAPGIGHRQTVNEGLGGEVYLTGRPLSIDDYDTYVRRAGIVPPQLLGAIVGVPLTSGDKVVGVIGLASGSAERTFREREIDALSRFAQLASIALDNARLVDVAQQGALYDPVTGLPNRELLTDRIAHSLTRARQDDAEPIAVILLDLDRFKVINESVGHAVGDRLLAAVGQRLAGCLRPGDTVARFAGDEFGIILDAVADEDEARRVAERLANELRAPFPLGGRDWFISASMGIALGQAGHTTPDELLREAEIARVRAKSDPAHRHALFEPSMSAQTLERIDLENDLRRGIARGELRVHYQPIMALATEQIVGFEALVRWQHPRRGLVQPVSFIPLAEETGLIVPLGRWVLETACRQAAEWRDARPDAPPVMSVNLSARQFMQTDLAEDVAGILAETGLDAASLELEITESVVMDQSEAGIRTLRRLRAMGVRLVLDDFGTGYSSLSYLKHLPLDTIKIDRSFVAGLDGSADRSIVEAVIALAHGLGIGVVAEGIETIEQQQLLLALGCDLGQGYLFSRPVPRIEAARLLQPRRPGRRKAARAAKAVPSSGRRTAGA
jgi:diguanylate cyclase (GGDEF)-like protein